MLLRNEFSRTPWPAEFLRLHGWICCRLGTGGMLWSQMLGMLVRVALIYPDMQPTRKALDAYVHLRRQRMRTATIERAAPCRESEASNSARRLASSTHMRRDSYIREGLVPQMFISAGSVGCDVEPPIQVASRCWTHEGHR